jgi:hypothetical protein
MSQQNIADEEVAAYIECYRAVHGREPKFVPTREQLDGFYDMLEHLLDEAGVVLRGAA